MDEIKDTRKLKVMTKDTIQFEVDVRIKNFVKIFSEILDDYDIEEVINLNKIDSSGFRKILDFCEQLNYSPFEIKAEFKSNKQLIANLNSKAKAYYDSIKLDEIEEFINLADYLEVRCLSFLCNLKLGELFSNYENLTGYILMENLIITSERELELREKYMNYNLDKEIDETLLNEYLIQNE